MSILFHGAEDGDDGPFSLASASGWAALAAWFEAAPAKEYPTLRRLALYGFAEDTAALGAELRRLLSARPPKSKDVAHTAQGLLYNLGVGSPRETATVLD